MSRLLGTETVSVQHRTQSQVGGNFEVSADGAAFDVVASVQPTSGEVLQMLPEAARTRGAYSVFAEGDPGIRTSDVLAGKPADRITRGNGQVLEVIQVRDWTIHARGIPHHEYICTLVGADE